MIGPNDVMPLLLEACPSFGSQWAISESENGADDPSERRLCYLDAGDFVRHLVDLRLAGDTSEFGDTFDAIERLLTEGDAYVCNLAEIGYIEGLQMMTVTSAGLSPEGEFRPWLRPKSAEAWERLNESWGGPAG